MSHTVQADKIYFGVDPGSGDRTAIFSVQKVGWEWVPLPKPSLWQRLRAWWAGKELPTEELREKLAIALNANVIVDPALTEKTMIPMEYRSEAEGDWL